MKIYRTYKIHKLIKPKLPRLLSYRLTKALLCCLELGLGGGLVSSTWGHVPVQIFYCVSCGAHMTLIQIHRPL